MQNCIYCDNSYVEKCTCAYKDRKSLKRDPPNVNTISRIVVMGDFFLFKFCSQLIFLFQVINIDKHFLYTRETVTLKQKEFEEQVSWHNNLSSHLRNYISYHSTWVWVLSLFSVQLPNTACPAGRRWCLKHLVPCHPWEKPGWSSWYLSSDRLFPWLSTERTGGVN